MNQLDQQFRRNINYVGRDFPEFRQNLINFIKVYFPNTFNDFSETDPMMMSVELMSAIGDTLSYYTDQQLRESLLSSVEEKINLYNLANTLGYKIKQRTPAQVKLDVYQLVPAEGQGSLAVPNMKYAQIIAKDMIVQSQDGVYFRTTDSVDFRASSSFSPTNVSIHSVDTDGNIEFYLLKKQVHAISGEIITRDYEFNDPKPYDKITLPETNVLDIVDVVDNDGNKWYEVPYLAQDTIPIDVQNMPFNNPSLAQYNSSVPYILCYRQTERRFVTRLRKDDRFELQFGSGTSQEADEEIVPNPFNVGIGLKYFERTSDLSIDPKNFLYTRTYGTAPSNVTLTVRYSVGGGFQDNVSANLLNSIVNINYLPVSDVLDSVLLETVRDSIVVNNPESAYGGLEQREFERVRLEAMAHFAAQNRAVTREDYILRCYSMPVKYGAIAKAYIVQDEHMSTTDLTEKIPNPYALNLYVIAYDNQKKFVNANPALKENLKNYLKEYRLMTDAIAIKDAHIINLELVGDIIIRPTYNSNEVILRCISRIKELFSNEKLEINQPIYLSKIASELDKIDGVQSIVDLQVNCLYDLDQGYSGNFYDTKLATRNRILYPSLDPSIFEIRFPDKDIKFRVVEF